MDNASILAKAGVYTGQTEWEDVTEFVKATAKGMQKGQMLHLDSFSLQKSLSALELMDPKMDGGMITGKKVITVDLALQQNLLPLELSVEQVIAVIDELTVQELRFHNGASLVHTMFTCLYVHATALAVVKSPVLQAYIRMLLQTCRMVLDVVKRADVYHEEDMTLSLSGMQLRDEAELEADLSFIGEQERLLERQLQRAHAVLKGKPLGKFQGINPLQDDKDKELALVEALRCRLAYRKAVFTAHLHVGKAACKGLQAGLKHVQRALSRAELLCGPDSSVSLGADEAPGFEASIASTFNGSGPPRKPIDLDRRGAYALAATMLKHMLMLFDYSKLVKYEDMISSAQTFTQDDPGIVARSHLLVLMHSDENFLGKGRMHDIVLDAMHRFSPSTKPHTGNPEFKVFLGRLVGPTCLLFRLFCDNHARQRRKVKKLLADWAILQQEASMLDAQADQRLQAQGLQTDRGNDPSSTLPYRYPFFSWVFDQSTTLQCHMIKLGFGLELYRPEELPFTSWYLEYLLKLRLRNRELCWRPGPAAVSKGGKKKKKKKAQQQRQKPPASPHWYLVQAHMLMARGQLELTIALEREGLLRFPQKVFGSAELVTLHRFHSFNQVQPGVPTLALFQGQYPPSVPAKKMFELASSSFNLAKSCVEETAKLAPQGLGQDQLKALKRVCVSNAVCIMTLPSVVSKHNKTWQEERSKPEAQRERGLGGLLGDIKVVFDYSVDRTFAVFKLKAVEPKAGIYSEKEEAK